MTPPVTPARLLERPRTARRETSGAPAPRKEPVYHRIIRIAPVGVLALALSACASTPTAEPTPESPGHGAIAGASSTFAGVLASACWSFTKPPEVRHRWSSRCSTPCPIDRG